MPRETPSLSLVIKSVYSTPHFVGLRLSGWVGGSPLVLDKQKSTIYFYIVLFLLCAVRCAVLAVYVCYLQYLAASFIAKRQLAIVPADIYCAIIILT